MRINRLGGKSHTAGEAATANRHQNSIHVLQLVNNLQGSSSLACQYLLVIKRMNVDIALFLLQIHGLGIGIIEAVTVKNHLGTISAGCLNLQDRRSSRHADNRLAPQLLCRKCHALGMIAGRSSDNALLALLIRKLANLIVRATQLEGACIL